MNRFRLLSVPLSAVLVLAAARGAYAQPPSYAQPRTSPYLNLLRAGSSPGVNYYGLVRPEVDFRRSIQQLQTQTQANQQTLTGLQTATGALTTGHPVGFMTHTAYFQTVSAAGGAAFQAPTGGQ